MHAATAGGRLTHSVSGIFHRIVGLGAMLTLALALGACAVPRPRLADDAAGGIPLQVLSGRLALQVEGQPERSFAADFELLGTAERGELVLAGPLGATAARARWAPGEAVLVSAQGEVRHTDLDSLAREALGEALPMAALFDWLRGRPWPGAPAGPRADGGPGFAQAGWEVALDRLSEGRIDARRSGPPAVTVRIRLQPPG